MVARVEDPIALKKNDLPGLISFASCDLLAHQVPRSRAYACRHSSLVQLPNPLLCSAFLLVG